MDNNDFVHLVKYARERQDKILDVKGNEIADYADNNDRLSNFKQVAALLGVDQTTVAGVYLLKHVIAVCHAIRYRELSSKPLEGRLDDLINYALLLTACLQETDPELIEHPSDIVITDKDRVSSYNGDRWNPMIIPPVSLRETRV